MTNPFAGMSNWTGQGEGSGAIEERLRILEQWRATHLDTDWWNSNKEFPHPNQSVSVLNFFSGFGRLSNAGIEILANDSSARRIKWVREYDQPYTNPGYLADLAGYTLPTRTEMYTSALFEGNSAQTAHYADGTLARTRLIAATVSTAYAQLISDEVQGNSFELINTILYLALLTADPAVLGDGAMWYRSDTDVYKGRKNGVTLDFLMSDYTPPAVPLTNLDVPYAATSSTPIGPGTSDTIIAVDATAGTRTINLLSAATVTSGFIYIVKKVDSSANTVVIDPSGAQTIEGAATFTLTKQNSVVAFVSDGSNWRILWYYVPQSSAISTKTAAYTVQVDDKFVLCDATAGAFTVTLPPVATSAGTNVTIKKTDSSVNVVTIDGNLAETIDGVLTRGLTTQYQYIVLAATAAAWFVVGFG